MEIKAVSKYVRMSPTKARDLARAIQGKRAGEALQVVEVNKRKAAVCIGKTLKSAIANAANNAKADTDTLRIKEATIHDGPRAKRFWPRARGSASPIRKKTSHIRVTLTDEKPSRKK